MDGAADADAALHDLLPGREEPIESEEREHEAPSEIRFFDKEVLAKKNRSMLRTKRAPTSSTTARST